MRARSRAFDSTLPPLHRHASAGEMLGPLHQTPLHLAVEAGDAELAGLLLRGGAPAGALDFDKKAPLHLALEMQVRRR